jgi:acetolactate synthase I/II/III large subunit
MRIPMDTTTAAAVARALADAGIDRVFGLPGGEILVLIDELRRAGVEFVLVRHEANAGIAAAVYGKLRRQPGVVLTTLGPGAANLMLPLCNSSLDQEPLLAISAQIPDDYPPTHTHQLLPLHDVYRPICKYVDRITAENATEVVPRAIAACLERPQGAAYLTLSAREALKFATDAAAPGRAAERPPQPVGQDPQACANELGDLLRTAKRPLVIVGLGVEPSNAPRIRRWITKWGLPVVVTPKLKGIVDETSTQFVGVVGGMAADALMCDALNASDLLIGLGLDPVEIDKTWHAELPIHWVLEIPHVGRGLPPGTQLVNHAAFLDAMTHHDRGAGWGGSSAQWRNAFTNVQQRRQAMMEGESEGVDCMWPGDIVRSLAAALPASTVVTTDVGSHKFLFGQFWPSREPETFWMSNGLSAMGYGLSAAIGAKLARPDSPVLAVLGDGGFSMNAQELETAERAGAPFVTLVLEDRSYSLIKLAQEGRRLTSYATDFNPIDTVKIAEACGVRALRTTHPDGLASTAADAVSHAHSLVIAVPVDYRDYRRLV